MRPENPPDAAFQRQLKEWIARRGVTTEEAAEYLGVSERSLFYWVSGNSSPSKKRVRELLRRMGTDVVLLLRSGALLFIEIKFQASRLEEGSNDRVYGWQREKRMASWLCKRLGAKRWDVQRLPHRARSSEKGGLK